MLILFFKVVALLYNLLDVTLYLGLHLLVLLGLLPLLMELLLELLYLVIDLLLLPQDFLVLQFLLDELPPRLIDFTPDSQCVMEVNLVHLPVCGLYIVAQLVSDTLFFEKRLPGLD